MSLYDYDLSKEISAGVCREADPPFAALIMAALRKADSMNLERLRLSFPRIWEEFKARYNAPGGRLEGEGDELEDDQGNASP